MNENVEHLVLEHLRVIRTDVSAMKMRLARIEERPELAG